MSENKIILDDAVKLKMEMGKEMEKAREDYNKKMAEMKRSVATATKAIDGAVKIIGKAEKENSLLLPKIALQHL
jgi:hypothetical protein